ncbi:MAG: HEAT repeat domain-containing protein [Candidatus Riflebacteria bacterium]|nr:HEAT repeat domain-containing protein [Candidatus Riflebacteria bacterium]
MSQSGWIADLLTDLRSPSEQTRRSAVIWLAQIGDLSTVGQLEQLVTDASADVRYHTRRAIHEIHRRCSSGRAVLSPSDSPEEGLKSPDAAVRLRMACALGTHPRPELEPLLLHVLSRESDVRVRATLVKALAALKDPTHEPVLLTFLDDSDPRVRANTVEALGSYASPTVLQRIQPLTGDPDLRVRGNALVFMGRREPQSVRPAVTELLAAEAPAAHATALYVLRAVGDAWCYERLKQLLSASEPAAENPETHRTLGYLTPRLGPSGGEVTAVASTDPEDGSPEAVGTDEASEPSGPICFTELTRDLDTFRSLGDWQLALTSDDYPKRIHAVQNAQLFPRRVVLGKLRRLMRSETHAFVLATLVKALGVLGEEQDVGLIQAHLHSPDPRVRSNAIEGLTALGTSEAVVALRALQSDPHPRVRATVARGMYSQQPEAALGELRSLLTSGEQAAERAALFALDSLPEPARARDVLREVLGRLSPGACARLLKRFEPLAGVSRILDGILDPSPGTNEHELPAGVVDSLLAGMGHPSAARRLAILERLARSRELRVAIQCELSSSDEDAAVRETARDLFSRLPHPQQREVLLVSMGRRIRDLARSGRPSVLGAEILLTTLESVDLAAGPAAPQACTSWQRNEVLMALGEVALTAQAQGTLQDPELRSLASRSVALQAALAAGPPEFPPPMPFPGGGGLGGGRPSDAARPQEPSFSARQDREPAPETPQSALPVAWHHLVERVRGNSVVLAVLVAAVLALTMLGVYATHPLR